MGENLAHEGQDPSYFTSANTLSQLDSSHFTSAKTLSQLDSAEPIDKKPIIKRKICPSSLDQLDSLRSSSFSFGLETRSVVVDPNPTPRFGPPVIEDSNEVDDRESKRRKQCPSYIVSNFSFKLDHNSDGSPESTPKFGSFTLTTPPTDQLETEKDPTTREEKEEDEKT